MYFSLVPHPGYNYSVLKKYGIGGEWFLFNGDIGSNENRSFKHWGGNGSIKGILNSLVPANF